MKTRKACRQESGARGPACFNEAAPVKTRKVQSRDGRLKHVARFNEAAPVKTRKGDTVRQGHSDLSSFNEAAPVKTRKVEPQLHRLVEVNQLQRGRAGEDAEGRQVRCRRPGVVPASTRPRR